MLGNKVWPEGSWFEETVPLLFLRWGPSTRDGLSTIVEGAYRRAEHCAADNSHRERPGWKDGLICCCILGRLGRLLRTSDSRQEPCSTSTSGPVQRVILFPRIGHHGFRQSERSTHSTCSAPRSRSFREATNGAVPIQLMFTQVCELDVPKNPIVPPVLVKTPKAPWLWELRAF